MLPSLALRVTSRELPAPRQWWPGIALRLGRAGTTIIVLILLRSFKKSLVGVIGLAIMRYGFFGKMTARIPVPGVTAIRMILILPMRLSFR